MNPSLPSSDFLEIGERLQERLNYLVRDVQNEPHKYFPLRPITPEEDVLPLDPEEWDIIKPEPTEEPAAAIQDNSSSTLESDKDLEVLRYRKQFLELLEKHQVLVVSGETGCGKTTQLPQFVLDSCQQKGQRCNIVCTQPRRLSAIMVAQRVADERKQDLGENVGYKVRLNKKPPRSKNGSILFCTTGILLQNLKSSRLLEEYSHVFLDEAHERSMETDFLLIIMKELVKQRKDLRVVLMSASMDQSKFAHYFDNCQVFDINVRRKHTIKNYYLEDMVSLIMEDCRGASKPGYLKSELTEREKEHFKSFYEELEQQNKLNAEELDALKLWPERVINMKFIRKLINSICDKEIRMAAVNVKHKMGAILVFLPGWNEITALKTDLEKHRTMYRYQIYVLHSMVPFNKKIREAINRTPTAPVCKIILATNIAETSITIQDVVYVIDCGKANTAQYSAEKNFNTLSANWISKANAIQRAGRAGRVRDGECYRLFTSARYHLMSEHIEPEICHLRLEVLCLRIKNLKLGSIIPFLEKALSVPPLENVKSSIHFLQTLNALSPSEELTPLGYHLSRLPLDPQTGKMIILGAIFSCLDPILTIAASLAERDIFYYTQGNEKDMEATKRILGDKLDSDHLLVANVFQQISELKTKKEREDYCLINHISIKTMIDLDKFRRQLFKDLVKIGFVKKEADIELYNKYKDDLELRRAIICAGLYPNLAMASNARNSANKQAVVLKQGPGFIHKKSSVCQSGLTTRCWAVFYQSMKQKDFLIHDVTYINPLAMILFSKDLQVRKAGDNSVIKVDGWAEIKATPSSAAVLQRLRDTLHQVLNYRFQVPGVTDWDHEGKVLRSVLRLLKDHKDKVSQREIDDMMDFG